MEILALFGYQFFQRALLAGVFWALAASLLGLHLILRKDAMLGHGLTHIAFAGVAIALFTNLAPFPVALLVSAISAFAILKVRERAGLYGDTAVAILSSLGIAVGIILASLSQHFNVSLFAFLFGNILAVSPQDLWASVGLAVLVVAGIVFFYHELLFTTFDEESARASGLPVSRLDALLALLTSFTVVIGMKIVGLLLMSALLVIPGAAALQLASTFKQCSFLASLVAVLSIVGGLITASFLDLPPSGAIVLFAGGLFFVFFLLKRI